MAAYAAAACAGVIALAASSANAQVWRFGSSISVLETYTNNANLEASGSRQSDLVSQITPAFTVTEKGAHTSLVGTVSVPFVFHARTSSENSSVQPQVNVLGNAELVPRFFFIEGTASVSQQYLSPFGPQPASLATSTRNRYTNATYSVTPYIKGAVGNDLSYELRDSVIWTKNYGESNLTNNSTTNELTGTISRTARPFGWALDIERTDTKYENGRNTLLSELARLRGLYQIDPQLQVSLRGGYEHDDYGPGSCLRRRDLRCRGDLAPDRSHECRWLVGTPLFRGRLQLRFQPPDAPHRVEPCGFPRQDDLPATARQPAGGDRRRVDSQPALPRALSGPCRTPGDREPVHPEPRVAVDAGVAGDRLRAAGDAARIDHRQRGPARRPQQRVPVPLSDPRRADCRPGHRADPRHASSGTTVPSTAPG